MSEQHEPLHYARRWHEAMPLRIRDYLNHRGILDAVIDTHLLGWNGERITIPVYDREGRLVFARLAKDPHDPGSGPKMLTPAGGYVELYGWERVRVRPPRIVICEGEYDRLVLESRGIAAVTSTGGAGVFRVEWAEAFHEIPEVYLCFDRDEAGLRGSTHVARLVPHAKIIKLPEEVGEGGDVTDFFVGLGRSRESFEQLMEAARPLSPEERPDPEPERPKRDRDPEIDRLKERVSIEEVIGRYVELHPSGPRLVGRCPFHEERNPSFTVYGDRHSFRCYGCGAHGDVLEFLMRVERLTFPEALEVLRNLAA